ncbi:MAG: hypothetical protein LUE14_01510 [Clostridiales bacterium]|nr:hypothetical protein [Clostridiales bacterium]
MKNNTFAEDYRIFKTYEAEYDAAKDEDGKEAARVKVRALYADMETRGEDYGRVYMLYKEAQERGNEYIDLHENIWDKDVKALVDSLRRYGIEHFTFSSRWSSTVETAWLFLQNGCTLEGMRELHGSEKNTFGRTEEKEFETVHGYLFKVN